MFAVFVEASMGRYLFVVPALLCSAAAQAQTEPNIGPRTLKVFPQGEERCYRATFEALKKAQIVQSFQLYRLLRPNPAKEAIEMTAAEAIAFDKRPDAVNWAQVVVRLKGHDSVFDQSLSCYDGEEGTHMRCGVDCDGGSFTLSPAENGVAIAFEEGNGLALNSSCGDPDDSGRSRWLTGAEAGTAMMLASQPVEACVAGDRAAKPSFAADETPLRQRIGPGKWNCLSRDYDKAHLGKHPAQKVKSIALAIEDAPKTVTDEYGYRTTVFDADLSVVLRDGSMGAEAVQCTADEYQFRCGESFRLRRNDGETAMLHAGAYGEDGGEAPESLAGLKTGADDLVFRLNGGDVARCVAK
jgi:hypothetical protein